MAAKQMKGVKGMHPFLDAFFVHRRYVGLYDDLECEDIVSTNQKFLIVYRKSTYVAPKAANSERVVPVRPARIVVEEDGKASFQVLFRVFQETETTDEFCELLKQLSAVGGYRLCSGLDEKDVSQSRASTVMHYIHPFERMEARGCLLWFSPKYRRKPLVNNLMARCPRCSVWTSHTKYQKKRSREELEDDVNNQAQLQQVVEETCNTEEAEEEDEEKNVTLDQQQSVQSELSIETTCDNDKSTTTPIFKRQENVPTSNVTVSIQSVREVVLTDDPTKSDSAKRQKVIQIQLVEDTIPQNDNEDVINKSSNGATPNIGWSIATDISSMISWNSNRTRITMESQEKEDDSCPSSE